MVYEFKLPDIGEGVAEGEVVQWFVHEGDDIREDAPLVSVLTDKANVEIPSPRSGKVVRIHAAVGQKVKVGGLLITIDDGSTTTPAAAAPLPSSAVPEAPVAPTPAPAAPAATPAPSASAPQTPKP